MLYNLVTNSQPVHAAETKIFTKENNALVKTEYGQCFLHSLYDRNREIKRLLAPVRENTQAIILFGSGLGDIFSYITKHFSTLEHLIIVEPNLDIFRRLLSRIDFIVFLKKCPQVTFIINLKIEDTRVFISQVMDENLYESLAFLAPLSYRTLYQNYYRSVIELSRDIVRRKTINIATNSYTSYRWLINEWRNQKHPHIDIETIMQKISPPPIIIVSAGPSLNKNIHLLPEAKQKALVLAVSSSMSILESHAILPHFRMAFDANQHNKNVFSSIDTATCPLIYSTALFHEILPMYKGALVQMVLNSNWISRYFRKKQAKSTILIRSGHTIANVAFDLACQWGSRKIILVGQDLCYTGNKMHASGAWDDNWDASEAIKKNWVSTKDIYGQPVYTDKPFLGMKDVFEELIAAHPHVKCINASEGGLSIAGAPNKTLRQVLDEDLTETLDLKNVIDHLLASEASIKLQENDTAKIVQIAESELAAIHSINQSQFVLLTEVHSLLERNFLSDKVLKKLRKFEKISEKLYRIDYYTDVVHPHLTDTYQILHRRFSCNSNETTKQVEALLNLSMGKATALKNFVQLSNDLIQEYQGKKLLNITYR